MPRRHSPAALRLVKLSVYALAICMAGACSAESDFRPILALTLTDAADPPVETDASDPPVDAAVDAFGDPDPDGDTTVSESCDGTESWDEPWIGFEARVVQLVNERRGEGAVCGGTDYGPAAPLTENEALRCAARCHARDMSVRDFFSHVNPDGDSPGDRIGDADYDARSWGENIAYGYPDPEAVVEGWMDSTGHCSNIMDPSYSEIGVGAYAGSQWVQVFGTPR